MARSLTLSVALLLCFALRAVSAMAIPTKRSTFAAEAVAAVAPPKQDPFYSAPTGFENAAPGAVLKSRSAPDVAAKVSNSASAFNVLYRTTDSNNKASWAVTTVFVPKTRSSQSNLLLSYQTPYDSANLNDSPSYTISRGLVDGSINAGLGQGWFVNVPDYEGPLASFTAGVQSGHATLDAVRAILNFGSQIGLTKSQAKYALWGYSGGALASEWAAELQSSYAPELKFAGIALGGLTPNVTSVLVSVNRTPAATLIVNGVLGITSQDKTAEQYVLGQLKKSGPYNSTGFLAARNKSTAFGEVSYANQDIFQYFTSGAAVLQNSAVVSLINRDGIMGTHGVPKMPIFAYKAINDEISKVADTDSLIRKYCGSGANILYQRNTKGGHGQEAGSGAPRAFSFLQSVFNGTFKNTACVSQDVTLG